jgi:hypothetical protein
MIGNDHVRFGGGPSGKGPVITGTSLDGLPGTPLQQDRCEQYEAGRRRSCLAGQIAGAHGDSTPDACVAHVIGAGAVPS